MDSVSIFNGSASPSALSPSKISISLQNANQLVFDLDLDSEIRKIEIEIKNNKAHPGNNDVIFKTGETLDYSTKEEDSIFITSISPEGAKVVIAGAAGGALITSIVTGAGSTSIVYLIKLF